MAGGLGERLGYSGVKCALPVCTISEDYSYLKFYCHYAKACEDRAKKLNPDLGDDFVVPFAIMTSNDTNDRMVALLESNNYYGLKQS